MSIKDWFKEFISPKEEPPRPPAGEADPPAAEYTRDNLQFDMEYNGRPLCLRPFFDVNSRFDQRLTGQAEDQFPLETDNLKFFRMIADPAFQPHNHCLVYQQWGPEQIADDGNSSRPYFWLDRNTAGTIGEIIHDSPTRILILIFTMPQPGALRELAERTGPGKLQALTLGWYLSGDDCTDDPRTLQEAGQAAAILGLRQLTLLTRAWDSRCDDALLDGLGSHRDSCTLRILQKDDEYQWPDFPGRATR